MKEIIEVEGLCDFDLTKMTKKEKKVMKDFWGV